MQQNKVKRVVFVQKFVPHYRLPLFELLRERLATQGIEFILVYGRPDPYEGSKIKMEFPEWGIKVRSLIIPLPGRYVYIQGSPRFVKKGDVVIVEHASKLIDNYVLFLLQQVGFLHLCYFGHGHNFQDAHELKIAAYIKKLMVKRISRWFAYTEMSVASLTAQDVEPEKIVTVNNSLVRKNLVDESTVTRNQSDFVYIGGLYADKRLDFLLESAQLVVAKHPEFRLHIVGDGPEADKISKFSSENSWCTYHGSLYNEDRERMLYRCNAILMPGLVGLVAIDSFHFAAPILSTNCGQHSPEVVYLKDGENATILDNPDSTEEFAQAIERQLTDKVWSEKLRQGCRESADVYSIENTADRFIKGILSIGHTKP